MRFNNYFLKQLFVKKQDFKFFRLLLHKTLFDTGFALSNYLKYPFILIGFQMDIKGIIWLTLAYAVFCYLLGFVWYWMNLQFTQQEIANVFNPFVHEVRDFVKKKKKKV